MVPVAISKEVSMTIICFELSMPSVGSWNGRWSGEGRCYARIRRFGRNEAAKEQAAKILAGESYCYNFGDGWGASVSVHQVTATEARKIERKSTGFYGYDWMIDSILRDGEILVKPRAA
jgi:hypothetical protein